MGVGNREEKGREMLSFPDYESFRGPCSVDLHYYYLWASTDFQTLSARQFRLSVSVRSTESSTRPRRANLLLRMTWFGGVSAAGVSIILALWQNRDWYGANVRSSCDQSNMLRYVRGDLILGNQYQYRRAVRRNRSTRMMDHTCQTCCGRCQCWSVAR